MREGVINRKTNETDIRLKLELDGSGKSCIDTGCGFLDHMLTLFARHGRFDLTISCKGDTEVDYHHTTEDIGIALGDAFAAALGDLRGVTRYGSFLLPMDEALIQTAVDLSGRAAPVLCASDPDAEGWQILIRSLTKEFFLALRAPCRDHAAHPAAGGRKRPPYHRGRVQVSRQKSGGGGQDRRGLSE